jgi:hypothetical protein
MTSPGTGRGDGPIEGRTPDGQPPITPEDIAERAATKPPAPVESFGLMPLLLGVVAVVMLALLVFGEPAPNQHPQPRGQSSVPVN